MTNAYKQSFTIKSDVDLEDLQLITLPLLTIFTQVAIYCNEHNLPFHVTSIISDRANVKEATATHREGRAFDMSTKGWPKLEIYRFQHYFNSNYKDYAAISKRDLKPRLVVVHDYKNQGEHIHVQVKRDKN